MNDVIISFHHSQTPPVSFRASLFYKPNSDKNGVIYEQHLHQTMHHFIMPIAYII